MIAPAGKVTSSIWKSRWLSLLLLAADAVGLSLSWIGAYEIRQALSPVIHPINEIHPYLKVFPLIVIAGLLNCGAFGLYLHRRRLSSLNRPSMVLRAGYHWLLYIVVVAFFFKELDLGRSVIVLSALLGLTYLALSRTILRRAKTRAVRRGRATVRSVIVGATDFALDVKESLLNHPEIGFTLLGVIVHRNGAASEATLERLHANGIDVLGDTSQMAALVERHHVEEIFLAVPHMDPNEQFELLHSADVRGVNVHVVSDIFGVINEQAKVEEIAAFPVITLRDGHLPLHQTVMKRALDVLCSLTGIVLWLLCFHWWIALKIKSGSPGPVFFRQERMGRDGQRFTMLKYRTMRTDTDPYSIAPTDEEDPRITRFGRWLRKTSLDELPQLVNVLRGEMSMVGPRPEMPFIVEQYEPWQRRRLDVKPGVTGLWQVIGRKNLPLHLNMQYDFYYIKNQSFLLDVEILFRTIPAVLKGKGAF